MKRFEHLKIDVSSAQKVRFISEIPIVDVHTEIGADSRLDGRFKELIPCRMESLLLNLGLVDVLAFEFELAVGVTETVAVGGREVRSVQHVNTQFTRVVD